MNDRRYSAPQLIRNQALVDELAIATSRDAEFEQLLEALGIEEEDDIENVVAVFTALSGHMMFDARSATPLQALTSLRTGGWVVSDYHGTNTEYSDIHDAINTMVLYERKY